MRCCVLLLLLLCVAAALLATQFILRAHLFALTRGRRPEILTEEITCDVGLGCSCCLWWCSASLCATSASRATACCV